MPTARDGERTRQALAAAGLDGAVCGDLAELCRALDRGAGAALLTERERFRVALSSIGDAVVATDTAGRLTFLNPVAEELTRWDAAAARGRPLDEVLRIVHEHTRAPAENPALWALREGTVVGLA